MFYTDTDTDTDHRGDVWENGAKMTSTIRRHDKVTATIGRAAWHYGLTGTVREIYLDGEMAIVAYETADNGRVTVKLPTAVLRHV